MRCSVPYVSISQWAPKGLSNAPNTYGDNNATIPQVGPVTSGVTVYYMNPCSGPTRTNADLQYQLFWKCYANYCFSTTPMSAEGPKDLPTGSIAMP